MQGYARLFRSLNGLYPALGDLLIESWGKADLHIAITELLSQRCRGQLVLPESLMRKLRDGGLTLPDELVDELRALEEAHRCAFPRFARSALYNPPDDWKGGDAFDTIEAEFPHIAEMLAVTWGSPRFYVYIESLLSDTSGKIRQGFPRSGSTALFAIFSLHSQRFPHLVPRHLSAWDLSIH